MSKEKLLEKIHIKWLSKAKTAIINGDEMTVLPYGYLTQACSEVIDQTREETIRGNNLVDLTGKNGDTIYHNDGLTGKRYTWKCVNIEKLTN